MATKSTAPKKKGWFGFWPQVALTSVVAALFLLVANSAIWVNQSIFNTQNFTSTAVTSLTSESSRQALASEVVDKALADKPLVKNVAGDTATKLVSGLLGTNQFNRVLTAAVGKLQVYVTSPEQKSVTLDLTGVKSTVERLVGVANTAGVSVAENGDRLSQVPDQVVLVDANNIPSFYGYGLAFMWLAPICLILALVLLAYPYFRNRSKYYQVALAQGSVILVAGLLALLVGPLFRPPVLASITSPNVRTIVGNLYDAFLAQFNQQVYWLIVVGLVWAILPIVVWYGLGLYRKRVAKKK